MAMCSPCRSELFTGRPPPRNGCAWNHGTCRPGTKSLPHYLGALGYRGGPHRQDSRQAGGCLPLRGGAGLRRQPRARAHESPRHQGREGVHHPRCEAALLHGGGAGRAACSVGDGRSFRLPAQAAQASAVLGGHADDPAGLRPLPGGDHLHGRPVRRVGEAVR